MTRQQTDVAPTALWNACSATSAPKLLLPETVRRRTARRYGPNWPSQGRISHEKLEEHWYHVINYALVLYTPTLASNHCREFVLSHDHHASTRHKCSWSSIYYSSLTWERNKGSIPQNVCRITVHPRTNRVWRKLVLCVQCLFIAGEKWVVQRALVTCVSFYANGERMWALLSYLIDTCFLKASHLCPIIHKRLTLSYQTLRQSSLINKCYHVLVMILSCST